MTAHKLTVEGRWGYCVCDWSTGPAQASTWAGIQAQIHGDFRAHLRQRTEQHEYLPDDVLFDDELDDWADEVEDVLW